MRIRAVKLHTRADGGDRIPPGTVYETDDAHAIQLIQGGFATSLERQELVTWDNPDGLNLSPLNGESHYEARTYAPGLAPRVLQLTQYDPGSAAYRYHSAFNYASGRGELGGTSAFVRYGSGNPYCDLRQYDGFRHQRGIADLFESADVIHVHMDYTTLDDCARRWPRRERQLLVRHYHGSQSPESFNTDYRLVQQGLDDQYGALQIGARLYHPNRYGRHISWIPIPVPVLDYRALKRQYWRPVEERPSQKVRVCHSTTNDRVKGTTQLDIVMQDLMMKGLPVEYIKITNTKHGDCLRLKATCDITFDSFWLGIQGSGIEAAAMGQAVIAGDSQVRDEYLEEIGSCPYTFAKDHNDLPGVIERLVLDRVYREQEAARTEAYVTQYHDYAAVGAKYWQVVNAALKERNLVAA